MPNKYAKDSVFIKSLIKLKEKEKLISICEKENISLSAKVRELIIQELNKN